ncbi:hypothetical protein ALCH109712_13595 [Alkalicoccus chagannorensis]
MVVALLTMLVVVTALIGLNESSIQQAQELCLQNGGMPQVSRDILTVNWSFSCTT